jgi:hypothetical protein
MSHRISCRDNTLTIARALAAQGNLHDNNGHFEMHE